MPSNYAFEADAVRQRTVSCGVRAPRVSTRRCASPRFSPCWRAVQILAYSYSVPPWQRRLPQQHRQSSQPGFVVSKSHHRVWRRLRKSARTRPTHRSSRRFCQYHYVYQCSSRLTFALEPCLFVSVRGSGHAQSVSKQSSFVQGSLSVACGQSAKGNRVSFGKPFRGASVMRVPSSNLGAYGNS